MESTIEHLTDLGQEFWTIIGQMSPYLLLGFLTAGVLNVFISPEWIERHLGGKGIWPIAKASAFGVPLPICSCGVIPIAASLRRHGASKGATTAFLISTPQTGIDSIFVTFSLLGPVYAIFRPIVALLSGMLGGGLIDAADSDSPAPKPETCHDACCSGQVRRNWLVRIFHYGFVTLARDISRALVVGLIIAAAITALVPVNFLADQLGPMWTKGFGAMLVMMLLGIPVYVCATASVPVAAALIVTGISPGAALVFLMTGPATNAATIATVWKTMGRKTALLYLLSVGASAVGAGLLLDFLFKTVDIQASPMEMDMLPTWATVASAIALLLVLLNAMLRPGAKHHDDDSCDDHSHEGETCCEH
jgi:uncharacterized protein